MDFHRNAQAIDLNGGWSFAYDGEDRGIDSGAALAASGLAIYPCTVPGNFELDLQANGIIGDPFYGMNIAGLTKYERSHIWYLRSFEAADLPGCEAELFFEGLDCLADVYLNGALIGSCDNMLIEEVISVTGLLKGRNEMIVHIRPAVEESRKYDYPPSVVGMASNFESLYVRKAPHMYGWDIMPRAVSAGIWKPVSIRFRPEERLDRVFLETQQIAVDRSSAVLLFHYRARTTGMPLEKYEVSVQGRCGDSEFSAVSRILFDSGRFHVHVPNPELWWPKGRGTANLYDVTVTLLKNGDEVDCLNITHGIRTVELDRTSLTDAEGSGEFCFKVNGEKVFVLGANWVPADAYHSRDAARIPAMLELVDDIGCNAIRCWGGNVYEGDEFYDICDRKGIMIWQDFSMACALYPQDEGFRGRLAVEARAVVRRLRQHPSIILWSGDNECDSVWAAFGKDPNLNALTRDVLPSVLREEDWTRPYLPSSPYIDETAYKAGGIGMSEDHLWGPRDYYKGDFYKSSIAHFASEMGYHGCPSPDSIRKFISPEKVWPYTNNEEWILHGASPVPGVDIFDYRVELMAKQIRELFGEVPSNLDDFAFASQVSQAEAMKYFIELFRTTKWRRTGIIWWNVIDGWPQFSDAVVDYYFSKKLAYHVIKRSQSPVCLALGEPQEWIQELVACNDTRSDIELEYRIANIDSGEVMMEGAAASYADRATVIGHIPFASGCQRFYTIEWEGAGVAGRSHYLAGDPPFDLATYRGWLEKAYHGI